MFTIFATIAVVCLITAVAGCVATFVLSALFDNVFCLDGFGSFLAGLVTHPGIWLLSAILSTSFIRTLQGATLHNDVGAILILALGMSTLCGCGAGMVYAKKLSD